MCVALTLTSVLFYQYAQDRSSLKLFGLSGLVAGLAFVTHPLGIVAIATQGLHLVVSERRLVLSARKTHVVLACFAVAVVAWLGYILQDPESFRLQMSAQLARKLQLRPYWYQFWIARTHVITLVVVLGAAVWLSVVSLRKDATSLIAIAFACSFAVATYGRETGYFFYFYPWACCALAIVLGRLSRHRFAVYTAVMLAFANELAVLGHDIYRYRHRDHGALTRAVRDVVPAGKTVFIGPAEVSPYFAFLGRNPMRIAVPVSTQDPEAHSKIAEACDFIAVTVPLAYLQDVLAFIDEASPVATIDQGIGYRLAIYKSPAAGSPLSQ